MKAHRAAAEEHEGGDAALDVRDEDVAGLERHVEVLGVYLQVRRGELALGIE